MVHAFFDLGTTTKFYKVKLYQSNADIKGFKKLCD